MCVAVPGHIVEIVDQARRIGRVDVLGTPRLVNLAMLPDVLPGDWVLVQVGFAVEKIDEATAQETIRLLEEVSQMFEGELAPAVADVPAAGEGEG
ncbi:MAG: HypC/HybG/HupF family hydrogenase formation chaperone [Armatimonadota bacterium]|nr:HypC/HybG/HupF family hydrogenase formation chaperone [Armatimonadota bacterium]